VGYDHLPMNTMNRKEEDDFPPPPIAMIVPHACSVMRILFEFPNVGGMILSKAKKQTDPEA
jgi:hypothetical protein